MWPFKTRWCISKGTRTYTEESGGGLCEISCPPKKSCFNFQRQTRSLIRVSRERNVSRKNAKIFGRISHFFAKTKQNAKISRKCEYFVKTMSVITATINFSKELVEFSLL